MSFETGIFTLEAVKQTSPPSSTVMTFEIYCYGFFPCTRV